MKTNWVQRLFAKFRGTPNPSQETTTHSLEPDFLWWLVEGKLAGMAQPMQSELGLLKEAGIGAIVSLLQEPPNAEAYEALDLAHCWLPIPDGAAPSSEQVALFVAFVQEQEAAQKTIAVHCLAGWGRTGTLLAAYLIDQGATPREAIQQVRAAQPHAIQNIEQEQFLQQMAPSQN